jgi:hypothetical protein
MKCSKVFLIINLIVVSKFVFIEPVVLTRPGQGMSPSARKSTVDHLVKKLYFFKQLGPYRSRYTCRESLGQIKYQPGFTI